MDREEALKIVRDLYEKSLFLKKDKEAITILIPELKDSEDERIRKALIHLISEQDGILTAINGISVKDVLAYLEKQKDLEAEIEKAYKTADKVQYEMGFDAGVASVQPVEWSEEDRDKVAQYLHDRDERMLWSEATKITSDILDILRPQPHWKPSVEQMRAVFDASERNDKLGSVLSTLYNDLKKL